MIYKEVDIAEAVVLDYLPMHFSRAGHKFLFSTNLFGKDYAWLKDPYGTIYLEKING